MKEDKVYSAISKLLESIGEENIDKLTVTFMEDGVDIEIESDDFEDEISIDEMLDLDSDMVLHKTMATSLLMTEFRETLRTFLKQVDEVMGFGDKWADVINMILKDVSEHNKKNYLIQVIRK